MNRIIGDRREKSALDEMEEVAKQRNKDVAEEERLEAVRKAKEEAERAKMPPKPIIVPASDITPSDYNGVEFEAKAPRDERNKLLFTYNNSLERIRANNLDRHASPAETFSLLADNLEGKLNKDLKSVADDMLDDYGELLSMAVERKEDILTCYFHPEGVVWDNDKKKYKKKKFNYVTFNEFNVSGKKSQEWIPLEEFNDDFVKLIYGRSFKDLPQEISQGGHKAHVWLPLDGGLCLAGHAIYYFYCDFSIYSHDHCGASRGVRLSEEKQKEEEEMWAIEHFGWSGTDEDGFR